MMLNILTLLFSFSSLCKQCGTSGISEVLTAFFYSHLAKEHLWPIFNTFLDKMFYVLSSVFNFFQKINAIIHGTPCKTVNAINITDGKVGLWEKVRRNMDKSRMFTPDNSR